MKKYSLILPILAILQAGPVLAAEEDCPFNYEIFELTVPHVDLEECPTRKSSDGAFCRLSMGGAQVHLFIFDTEGDNCLLRVESFYEEDYSLDLGGQ